MPKTKEAPKKEAVEKTDIKKFKPMQNMLLGEVDLSEEQIASKRESEKQEVEESKKAEAKPDAKDNKEDFSIPLDDGKSPLDDDLLLDAIAGDEVKPVDDGKELTGEEKIKVKKEENSGIRSQIEEANKKLKLAITNSEAAKIENESLKQKLRDMEQNLQRSITTKDPSQHPDVISLVKPWDDELNSFVQEISLSGGDGSKLKAMTPQLIQNFQQLGEVGSPGYEERKDELMSSIDESFPDDRREVIRILSKGANVMSEAANLMDRIRNNSSEMDKSESLEAYEKMAGDFSELEKHFFNPSDEMRQNDPYKQRVIHRGYIDTSEAAKVRSIQTKDHLRYVFLPLKPLEEGEIRGMSNEEAAQYQQDRMQNHRQAQLKVRDMATEAFFSHALLPQIQKRLDEALSELQDFRDSSPRLKDGTTEEGGEKREGEEISDIKDFDPGRPNLKF